MKYQPVFAISASVIARVIPPRAHTHIFLIMEYVAIRFRRRTEEGRKTEFSDVVVSPNWRKKKGFSSHLVPEFLVSSTPR